MRIPERSTLTLTHYGRRSGKPFRVKIWYAEVDGELWIGSLDRTRNWVKNLAATGKADVDFGEGPIACSFEPVDDPAAIEKFRRAIAARHPIVSRILRLIEKRHSQATFRARSLG